MHGGLLLLIVFLDLLLLECENKFMHFLRVGRGSEDFHRIVFQDLDPRLDVGGVLAGIMANTQRFANEHRRDLRPQLLPGVSLGAEGVGQVAVQARRVARPVAKLMKRCSVVVIGCGELPLIRKVNAVGSRTVEGTVAFGVPDGSARRAKDVFSTLVGIPLNRFARKCR